MNKKDFKKCMQQGLGRCVLVLQSSDNIEKYKGIVLWGCLHNLSYDTQCEGTRAIYIYELTTYFDDGDYFLTPCIEAFEKLPRRSSWLFSHFTELLRRFAEDGNTRAMNALNQKYEYLLCRLLEKRSFHNYDFERDHFERICLTLSSLGGTEGLLKIAADMGRLFKENPHYNCSDFDWFCSSMDHGIGEARLRNLLQREAKKSWNVAVFYRNYLSSIEETRGPRNTVEVPTVEEVKNEISSDGKLSPTSRVRFSRRSGDEEKRALASEAIREQDLDKKAEMLSVFAFRDENFPLPHETIIDYSRSSHARLREVALDVLTNCQSNAVREYAMRLLSEDRYRSHAIRMLLCNYTPDMKQFLLTELQDMKIDYKDTFDWHGVMGKILLVHEQDVKLPKEFFIYVYNTTLCSYCRQSAIQMLAKHRWLTQEIIEECRYDSNYEISQYINRYYPPKN